MERNVWIAGGVIVGLVLWFKRPAIVVPTSEPTDDSWWSQGPTNYPWTVTRFADAIAHAEGYGIPGAIPTVANNPGDLVIPGWSPTMGSAGIAVFDSPDYGWSRLYRQIALIIRGGSAHYDLDMTLAEMGRVYAGGDDNWARNVAAHLGVSTSTTLGQVLT